MGFWRSLVQTSRIKSQENIIVSIILKLKINGNPTDRVLSSMYNVFFKYIMRGIFFSIIIITKCTIMFVPVLSTVNYFKTSKYITTVYRICYC